MVGAPEVRKEVVMPTMTSVTTSYVPPATDSMTDLLLWIRDGDPAAWDEILRRYGKLVSTTVRSFRLQEADALDAVQMTWLRLAENAHRVQFPERLGGWLQPPPAVNACTCCVKPNPPGISL